MKTNRIVTLIVLALCAAMPMAVNAQRGEKVFGVQTGYTSTNNSAIAGMFFQYSFSDHFRVSPEMGCVLRHEDLDAFTADLNFHFPLSLNHSGDFSTQVYPIVGADLSSWTRHHVIDLDDDDDVSTRKTKLGLNLGGGFQFLPSSSLKLKIEAKYTLMQTYSTFVASVGIGYVF